MCVCVFIQVFTEYFKELEEESIQDNFVVVYELLDELMDFGFPQTTDSKILQEWDSAHHTHTLFIQGWHFVQIYSSGNYEETTVFFPQTNN